MPTNNAWNSNIPVEISKGGTNATSMATTDGTVYYDGTRLVTTATGTSGQVLTSGGAGVAPSFQDNGIGDVTGPASATSTAIAIYDGTTGKLIKNSIPTIDTLGNIVTSTSNATGIVSITAQNLSAAANSSAKLDVQVADPTAGDPFVNYTVNGGGGSTWTTGIDNSDSDVFVIGPSSVGAINTIKIQKTGEINFPLQPTFAARLATTVPNVTGDNTVYTIIFDTEEFDVGSNFDISTGIFTAPITGKYLFNVICSIGIDTSTANAELLSIVTTAHTYRIWTSSSTTVDLPTGYNGTRSGTIIISMTAGDTAKVTIQVNGTNKTCDIVGESGSFGTYFSGILIA